MILALFNGLFYVVACVLMWNRSPYLTCIITTALLFVNPQHRTNFFGQNCTYSIRTDARQTNQSGHRRKIWHFLCLLSHNTAPRKRSRSFFSQKICSCSTITYNFFLCLRGYSLLPVRFPFHKLTSIFISLLIPVSFSIRSASMAAASIPLVL